MDVLRVDDIKPSETNQLVDADRKVVGVGVGGLYHSAYWSSPDRLIRGNCIRGEPLTDTARSGQPVTS